MKTMSPVNGIYIYNPVLPFSDRWYGEPRPTTRKKVRQTPLPTLDNHKHKQEVICAAILALSLLFAFVECVAGLALS